MVVEERFASLRHRDTETSFDPTHYRMYASTEGRWLSPDPVAGCPLHPENFDRYNYAGNNPVNLTDPSAEFLIGTAHALSVQPHDKSGSSEVSLP